MYEKMLRSSGSVNDSIVFMHGNDWNPNSETIAEQVLAVLGERLVAVPYLPVMHVTAIGIAGIVEIRHRTRATPASRTYPDHALPAPAG